MLAEAVLEVGTFVVVMIVLPLTVAGFWMLLTWLILSENGGEHEQRKTWHL
jgi:hypothetical protein